jgi:hypothetical protein
MTKKRRRNESLLIKVSALEKQALNAAAEAADVPASQIVRKAMKREIAKIEATINAKSA